jgi:hypothetical protein
MKLARILAAPSFSLVPFTLPALAFAQTSGATTFQALANTVVKILNAGAILMIVGALVVYFYSIAGNLFRMNQGEASGEDLRKTLLWGIVVLFIMVSIWGIIQFLQYSLFGGPPPAASNGVIIYQQ